MTHLHFKASENFQILSWDISISTIDARSSYFVQFLLGLAWSSSWMCIHMLSALCYSSGQRRHIHIQDYIQSVSRYLSRCIKNWHIHFLITETLGFLIIIAVMLKRFQGNERNKCVKITFNLFQFVIKLSFTHCYTWENFCLWLLHLVNNCVQSIYKTQKS